jgi:CRP-like cAMP-binding protein
MRSRSSVRLTRQYKKTRPLFVQGESCDGAFVVLHGRVALSTGNSSKQQIRLSYVDRGAVVGLAETIGGGPYQTTAIAATDVAVRFIPKSDVLSMMENDPTTGLHVIQILTGHLGQLYDRIKCMPLPHYTSGLS